MVPTWTLLAALAAGLILGTLGSRLSFRPADVSAPVNDGPPMLERPDLDGGRRQRARAPPPRASGGQNRASTALSGLRQAALYRLLEQHQQLGPFEYLIYAEMAGAEIGPVG